MVKQILQRKHIIPISISIFSVFLVVGGASYVWRSLTREEDCIAQQVQTLALTSAQQNCWERGLGGTVCDHLSVELSPPPAFGQAYWIAYVTSQDRKQFDVSILVDVNWG